MTLNQDRIEVDSQHVAAAGKVYLMLNKPRGLVTTTSDERGRPTVFDCLKSESWPNLSPVGRLDLASEGLLLLTNDTAWAARITSPESHLEKIYHVQVDCIADQQLIQRLQQGVNAGGEMLRTLRAKVLRGGSRNSWLELVLTEGKNRHIRRMLESLDVRVLRLIRVAIGPLSLGTLSKGNYRELTDQEVHALSSRSPLRA